jgi:membrane-associated protease RseP (regulator of RpoE activity)
MVKIALYILFLVGFFTILAVGCKSTDREEKARLVVQGITPRSAAEKVGIMKKDVIISYNGTPVFTIKGLNELKEGVSSDSVSVLVERGGKKMEIMLPKGQMGVYLKELLPDISYKRDAVVIEGIPPLEWSTGKSNSFHASIEAIANYLGIEKDYTYLYGVSGAAFRLHFHKEW